MLKDLLINYQKSYQENLIIEMMYEEEPFIVKLDRSLN